MDKLKGKRKLPAYSIRSVYDLIYYETLAAKRYPLAANQLAKLKGGAK
jgi:hypothetical protein